METAGCLIGPGECQAPFPLSHGGLLVLDEPEARSISPGQAADKGRLKRPTLGLNSSSRRQLFPKEDKILMDVDGLKPRIDFVKTIQGEGVFPSFAANLNPRESGMGEGHLPVQYHPIVVWRRRGLVGNIDAPNP